MSDSRRIELEGTRFAGVQELPLKRVGEYLAKVSSNLDLLEEGLHFLQQRKMLEASSVFREVERLEHEENEQRKQLSDEFSTGSIAADERGDYLALIARIDGIADKSNEVGQYSLLLDGAPKNAFQDLGKCLQVAKKTTHLFVEAVQTIQSRNPRILEICYEIEALERKADTIKLEAYARALKSETSREYAHTLYLVLDALEGITDHCEYCTDLLRSLYLKTV